MFAFPKLALLILVIAAVWVGYRWLNGSARALPRRYPGAPRAAIRTEDLVACRVCGAYVAAGAARCGRSDCPQPR